MNRVFSDEVAEKNKGGDGQLYRVTPIAIYLRPYKEQATSGYKLSAEQVYSHMHRRPSAIYMHVGVTKNAITPHQ